MFSNLGVIDWLALAFAAILLAGAAAAAVLAYATSRARTSVPRNGYAHAATAATPATPLPRAHSSWPSTSADDEAVVAAASEDSANGDSDDDVIDLREHRPQHAAASGQLDAAEPHRPGEVIPLHAATPAEPPASTRLTSAMPPPIVSPSSTVPSVGAEEGSCEVTPEPVLAGNFPEESKADKEAKLASRAARLRGRPVAETSPPTEISEKMTYTAPRSDIDLAEKVDANSGPDRVGFERRNPGFFEDPMGRHELRYWDGSHWTEYVKESGERFTDPL